MTLGSLFIVFEGAGKRFEFSKILDGFWLSGGTPFQASKVGQARSRRIWGGSALISLLAARGQRTERKTEDR